MKEFIRKNSANFFSILRILGSLYLLFTKVGNDFTPTFLVIYVLLFATDIIDGYLARKLDISSAIGVTFDTIGDALIGCTPVKVLIVQKLIPGWFLVCLGVTVAVFVAAASVSYIKFKKFTFPHTYFSKFNGCCVASSPFLFHIVNTDVLFIIVGTVFFIDAVEILTVVCRLKEFRPFVPSIFHCK